MKRRIENSHNIYYVLHSLACGKGKKIISRSVSFFMKWSGLRWLCVGFERILFFLFSCGANYLRGNAEPPSSLKSNMCDMDTFIKEFKEKYYSIDELVELDSNRKFVDISLKGSEEHQLQISTLIQSLSH